MSGPPVTESAAAGGASVRRLALVVATSDYLDTTLRRLRAPAGDAAELRDLLADPDIGGFSVTSVINERAHQVRLAVEDFLTDRHHDDYLLLYLSCHGLVDARRRLYFAARDTLKDRLASSGVDSHWLLEQLEDCRASRQVVILDCCFSGAFARGAKGSDDLGLGDRLVGDGRGRVVLTASRGTEYSFEGEPLQGEGEARGSVFTSALIEGIRTGRADTDADGDISVEDAYAYAFEQVRRAGTQQTPQRWLYGAEGSIVLAHTPPTVKRHSQPAPPMPSPRPDTASGSTIDPPPPTSQAEPKPDARAATLPGPRRRLLTKVGAGAAAAAVLAAVLIAQALDGPGSTSEGGLVSMGSLTGESPWRLLVHDAISSRGGNDIGCQVLLTDASGETVFQRGDVYNSQTFQMRESGTFNKRVNHPDCLMLPQKGAGDRETLPFDWSVSTGDTPVFDSPGTVTVSITDWEGNTTCELYLMSGTDGGELDIATAEQDQPPIQLEHNGPGPVFIAAPECSIEVDAA